MIVKTFRVPEKLWAKFVEACREDEENPSDVVRQLIAEYMERRGD